MRVLRRLMHWLRLLPTLLKRTLAKAWNHRILGLSAEAAFWQMLSLPSLFLALIASLGYVSRWIGGSTVDQIETQIEKTLSRAFSEDVVRQVVHPILREILNGNRADVISIGFVLALWAGSSATATFVNTIAIAYDMRDLRGPVRSRLLALSLFLGTIVFGVVLLPMLILGPDLLRRSFPESVRPTVSRFIDDGYYPVLVLLLLLGLTTFYKLAIPRRLPWRRALPGAILALLIFLAGSTGLRAYISYVIDKNHAYGTLASPIAALLFFFVLAFGVLIGAEFNAAIEAHKPARTKAPRVLAPQNWQFFREGGARAANGKPAANGQASAAETSPGPPVAAKSPPTQERKLS